MAQEDVEVVRNSLAAFNPDLDAVAKYWAPDINWRAIEGAPDDIGVFKGHSAMRRYYEQWYETFDDLSVEAEEVAEAGDHVIAEIHVTARMKDSDAELDMRLAILYAIEDGLIVRGREYATKAEALQVAAEK